MGSACIQYIKKEWFLMGMLAAIALAAILPSLGQSGGLLHLDTITGLGIALIFFLHGVGLSPKAIKQGISNWRLHIFVQSATFIVYPLLWLLLGPAFQAVMPSALAFGFCYLFVLPSTISSSVAMTSVAKGNVPAAIFNASLSSLLGVLITPFLIQLFMGMEGVKLDILDTVLSISKLLLLPMVVGQLCRPIALKVLEKRKTIINKIDKWVILLIVYNAFSDSVADGIWHDFEWQTLGVALIAATLVLLLMVHSITWAARRAGFSREDEITAVFCGTKKTLAAGVPMAKVIFGANPMLGMILLPIMFYHQIQILYCAILANRYAKEAELVIEKQ
ncbi:bile acid:sodium symporter [Photobacterium frigidiphilum]|uniref:Bile acid:sodium symporter n=1 Tax=Photobacterium frigidiphilum TaxID=264736 RepID=A0A2T3JIW0_9GAMM|nr:bile acid:sodium symporter family protein [Photobacterium frigidiphilum]PSU48915.1 bile acid:sodium symporter [Photobacterium frigidiphilum]